MNSHDITLHWKRLLSRDRLNFSHPERDDGRSPFEKDADRIIFSSAFRRLQDKTQVYPFSGSDYVRTRLTHSIEVSCVGRSLGALVGRELGSRKHLPENVSPSDIGAIVSAACLAHDIGNPPFGHSGEDAIQHWAKTSDLAKILKQKFSPKQQADLDKYEGNASGFRVLSRLLHPDNPGLQLTKATLATIAKYPCEVSLNEWAKNDGVGQKKFGFFQSDKDFFTDVAESVGLKKRTGERLSWHRHPLAFLSEAADDICYLIVDLEDAFRFKLIPFDELRRLLLEIINTETAAARLTDIKATDDKSQFLRAMSIGKLIGESVNLFLEKEDLILEGTFDSSLAEVIPSADKLKQIRSYMVEHVYSCSKIVEVEVAGYDVIFGLLDTFIGSAEDVARVDGHKPSSRSGKLMELIPAQFFKEHGSVNPDPYIRTMRIIDYVSGMTDSYAVSLYKRVKGISLS